MSLQECTQAWPEHFNIPVLTVLVKCQPLSCRLPSDSQQENDGVRKSAGSRHTVHVASPIGTDSLGYSHIPNLRCSLHTC